MLTRMQKLNPSTLKALASLQKACQKHDGYTIPVYPHLLKKYRKSAVSFLYYDHKQQLIAFLSLFHFYTDACEAALLVHPKHRQQGLATMLWKTMLLSLRPFQSSLKHLIISTPKGLNKTLLKQHVFDFDHSEYDMECTTNAACTPPTKISCSIRKACDADIPGLCHIDRTCFNAHRPNPGLRIKASLDHPNKHIFVAFYQHQIIGQVYLTFENESARLTDLAVLPEQQRQGIGEALVACCLYQAHKHHQARITLAVSTENQAALFLYKNMGFSIYNAVDYYKHRLTDFELGL